MHRRPEGGPDHPSPSLAVVRDSLVGARLDDAVTGL